MFSFVRNCQIVSKAVMRFSVAPHPHQHLGCLCLHFIHLNRYTMMSHHFSLQFICKLNAHIHRASSHHICHVHFFLGKCLFRVFLVYLKLGHLFYYWVLRALCIFWYNPTKCMFCKTYLQVCDCLFILLLYLSQSKTFNFN